MKSTRQQSMWIELGGANPNTKRQTNKQKQTHPFPNLEFLFAVMERSEWARRKWTRWQHDNNKNNRKTISTFCYKFFGLATAASVTIHFQHHNLSLDWNKRTDLMKSFSLTLMFTLTTFAIYAIFTVHYRHTTRAFTRSFHAATVSRSALTGAVAVSPSLSRPI